MLVMLKKALAMIMAAPLLAALFIGCASQDNYLTNYAGIQEGVTTKREVLRIYGKPKFILPNRDGSEQWSYDVDVSGDFVDKHHTFTFNFDRNGVVINKWKYTSKWP